MKLKLQLAILGLGLINGMTAGAVNVIVDGQVIQSADISAISINPTNGNISISAGNLYTVTRDGGGGGGGPQVVINSLTASSTSVTEGAAVTLSWSTTDAASCTPSGGFGTWTSTNITLPSGSSAPITMSTQGSYNFTLTCTNATPSSATRTVTVNVSPVVVGNSCPGDFVAPLSGRTATWASVANNNAWPNPVSLEKDVDIPKKGYLAIEFNTADWSIDGIYKTVTYYQTQGARYGAISKCPGDFQDHLPDLASRCSRSWYTGGSLYWTTEGNPAYYQCVLQPNTTYYMNLTFTADGVDPATDQCTTDLCRTEFNSSYY